MARAKLTDEQKSFIDKNHTSMSIEDMVKDMNGIGARTVEKYLEEVAGQSKTKVTAEDANRAVSQIDAGDKPKGHAVMDSAQSSLVDQTMQSGKIDLAGKAVQLCNNKPSPQNVKF